MATHMGVTLALIALQPFCQNISISPVRVPATGILQGKPLNRDKFLQQFEEWREKLFHAVFAKTMSTFRQQYQFLIPRGEFKAVYSIMSQQAVAVFEATVDIFPGLEKIGFHVKHQPIDKLATNLWASFEQ